MKAVEAKRRAAVLMQRYEARRQEMGVDMAELSRRTGIQRTQLHGLLNGRNLPSVPNLIRLADGLKITLDGVPLPLDDSRKGG